MTTEQSTVKPGDTVENDTELGGKDLVVVDVVIDSDKHFAILREREDLQGENLIAKPVDQVVVTGHLHEVEGWVQTAPGEWEQV